MAAYGCLCFERANKLSGLADLISAISVDAFDCKTEAFHPLIHKVRNQKGQIKTAQHLLKILKGSEIANSAKSHVQDPYSFRCIPQVHGATKDALNYCEGVLENEINAVTDNPLIFPDDELILSGGNFHGQPLALMFDFMGIAMSELANISERRTYRLLSGTRGLPAFLSKNSGLNSGLMIPQYTAASLVSQNKQLATPASVDSISSSNEQEDHVSMGANAATKTFRIIENVEKVLAIELLTAAQALEFRRPAKSSETVEKVMEAFRKKVTFLEKDRLMKVDIDQAVDFLKSWSSEFAY
jgi:histidine ammonia-lyase